MHLYKHPGVCFLAVAVLTVAVIFSCHASEQSRRFPLELEILAANARVLLSATTTSRQKHGLHVRMSSSLGTLRFLAREYLQTKQQSGNTLLHKIGTLRQAFNTSELQTFAIESRRLAQHYPVVLTGLRPSDASPRDISAGRRIYHQLCMACHEHPDTTQSNPAQDLFSMARAQPQREFIARLIAGVHGTPAIALRNPFSDAEIAGLAAYLTQAKHPR